MILAFAVRGLVAGVISQIFGVLGLVAGLWAAGWVSHWVESHWRGAQPAVAFLLLRLLIVLLTGLAVAALFRWWGELLRDATKKSPAGWLDRPAGFVVGAGLGAFVASFTLLTALLIPWPRGLSAAAAQSRMARPTMERAAQACSLGARFLPGTNWLHQRFLAAERRAERRPAS